jgi:chemotaxis signal transduction protein
MSARTQQAADADSLRRSFDESFAAPPRAEMAGQEMLLAIGAGEQDLAVRLSQIARIELVRRCMPVPDAPANLLGLVGSHDRLFALFSLAALLGRSSSEAQTWMMMVAGEEPVALAFSRFDGLLPVAAGALSPLPEGGSRHRLIPELVNAGGKFRGVLDVATLVAGLGEGGR